MFVWYGTSAVATSFFDGSISIKTLVLPECSKQEKSMPISALG